MGKRSQLWLPKLSEFSRVEKYPQPHLNDINPPKKYEIMHHPFDLKFRGRVGRWIESISSSEHIRLKDVLTDEELKLILLYFYPQGKKNKWLNQDEVSMSLPSVKYWDFRDITVSILEKIWDEVRVG